MHPGSTACAGAEVGADASELAAAAAIRRKDQLPEHMHKYWRAREALFSRFHEGVMLDEESWYSVTPEAVAYRLAIECQTNVILDAFCGAGGNAIQFAMTCEHGTCVLFTPVVAIEIDPIKVEMARHNGRRTSVTSSSTLWGRGSHYVFVW